ncbi:MAG TPA: FAD-dependent oxidoreductase, partial [Pseudonocardiaceae bacterium]
GGRVTVHEGPAAPPAPQEDGSVLTGPAANPRRYDVVVVAAGPWTGALLRSAGLPHEGYRTKSIQYSLHPTGGWRPPHFVDGVTGLFGRPTDDGGLLLGLPTDLWDIDPAAPPTTPDLRDEATRLARARFPTLDVGDATEQVGSVDCYAERPVLALRPVLDSTHRLFTFSGGAGGSVKTALAAGQRAALQLVEARSTIESTSVGRRKGQP